MPYGEILGVGASSAAVPINAWPDKSAALVRTMRLALEDAGLRAEDVHVVYASANATRLLITKHAIAARGKSRAAHGRTLGAQDGKTGNDGKDGP